MEKKLITVTFTEDQLVTIMQALLTPQVAQVISVIDEIRKQAASQALSAEETA